MKIYFVRHGKSTSNRDGLIGGHKDFELDSEGIKQAELLSERLKEEEFDEIITSDLVRASKTAEIINKNHGKEIVLDETLREQNWGYLEGEQASILNEKYSGPEYFLNKRPKRGESILEYKEKVENRFEELLQEYNGKKILVVSHGGFIKLALMYFFNEELENHSKYKQGNTALSILDVKNKELILNNCEKHLGY